MLLAVCRTRPPFVWGVTNAERLATYPCDELVDGPTEELLRAVSIAAPRSIVFRWLCQLKTAPYSYDFIDNRGRTSPRSLTPGLQNLEVGQRVADIFELTAFAPDEHLALRITDPKALRLFGSVTVSYVVREYTPTHTRLVVKLLVAKHPGALERMRCYGLAWGDLIMMRRQLLNFRDLAEAQSLRATLRE
jgi:hypothetical protein